MTQSLLVFDLGCQTHAMWKGIFSGFNLVHTPDYLLKWEEVCLRPYGRSQLWKMFSCSLSPRVRGPALGSNQWRTCSRMPSKPESFLRVGVMTPRHTNEEPVCDEQHMLATAVFYYTLSNMRNLGWAIWQACKLHIQLPPLIRQSSLTPRCH